MSDREIIDLYKKQIELFLRPIGITKRDKSVLKDPMSSAEDKKFILSKIDKINAGNYRKDLMNIAIDELLPYLKII